MTTVVRVIYVAYFLEVGLALVVMPWSDLWLRNYFVEAWPWLARVAGDPYVKGAVSGLGLVNLALGISDLTRLVGRRPGEDALETGGPDRA
ncbi:MAG: hypothetical protein AB1806_04320 [Acidobacteriota bacterium]